MKKTFSGSRTGFDRDADSAMIWILDTNIQSFFDEIDHDWMLKSLTHRVAEKRLLGLVDKWLKAGVIKQGCRITPIKRLP